MSPFFGCGQWPRYDIWAKPDETGFSLLDGILRDLVETERETDNPQGANNHADYRLENLPERRHRAGKGL